MSTTSTIDSLQQRLQDLELDIKQVAPSGTATPGFEQEYDQLTQEAEDIRRQIQAIRVSSPTHVEPTTEEDPPYRFSINEAEAARRRGEWDDALEHLEGARTFARGRDQINAVERLIQTVERERREAEIAEIDQRTSELLAKAMDLANQDRYVEAIIHVEKALATARFELQVDVKSKKTDLLRRQEELSGALIRQLETSIGQRDYSKADTLLAKFDQVDPSVPALIDLRRKVSAAKEQRDVDLEIQRVQTELTNLWSSGLVRDARIAKQVAEKAASSYPQNAQFKELVEEAVRKETFAAEQEQVWVTSLSLEEFQEVVADLSKRQSSGASELPVYEIREEIKDGKARPTVKQVGYAPAGEAVNKIVAEIGRFSTAKATRNRKAAEQAIPADPRHAADLLTSAEQFPYLPDAEKKGLQDFRTMEIEPRVRLRDKVDRIASEPSASLDPIAGWKSLLSATKLDPAARSIVEAKTRLWPSVASKVQIELVRSEEALAAGRWEEAEKQAAEFRDLLEANTPSQVDLFKRADIVVKDAIRLQTLKHEIDAQTEEMERLIKIEPVLAEERLHSIQKNIGEFEGYFPIIASWNDLIRARKDLHSALREIEDGQRELSQTQLEQRLDRLRRLQEQFGEPEVLKETRKRLELRRQFLIAQRLFNTGGGFRDESEAMLREIVSEKAQDADTAQKYLDTIQSARMHASKAARALEDAKHQADSLSNYSQAIDLLKPWFDQPGELGQQVREQSRSYEGLWQERLESQLNAIKNNPKVATLQHIEQLLEELKKLAPVAGSEWQQTNMPSIYARAAAIAQKAGGESLKTSYELLDKAVKLAPMDVDLQQKRRAVARALTMQLATSYRTKPREQRAQGLSDAQSEWLKFVVEYQDDAKAWLELAKLSVERGRFGEALQYLDTAQGYDQMQDGANQPSISQLRETAEREKDIQETQEKVEAALREDNHASQYRSAISMADELRLRYRDRASDIEHWFGQRKQELIQRLVSSMVVLPVDDAARWALAVKVMTLDQQVPEAIAEIRRAVQNVGQLEIDTKALLMDFIGPTEIPDGDIKLKSVEPSRSLHLQIEEAEELQQRAFAISALLDQQALSLGQAEGQQSARACVEDINRRLRELNELDQMVKQGRARLRGARGKAFSSSNWGSNSAAQPGMIQSSNTPDPFDGVRNVLGDIRGLEKPFSQHVTVEALRLEVEQARQRRTEIESLLKRLQEAVNKENFGTILKLINAIQQLDANGEFEVFRNVRIHDPLSDENLLVVGQTSDDNIKSRTEQRLAQWETVDAWQQPMGLQGWRLGDPIPNNCQRLSWPQHGEPVCQNQWRQGLFKEAKTTIEETLGTESSVVPSLGGKWSLRHCQKYLSDACTPQGDPVVPVQDPRTAMSQRVLQIATARTAALQAINDDIGLLEGPRAGGNPSELERLSRNEADFYSYLAGIGDELADLEKRKFGLFGPAAQERAEICSELNRLIAAARAIAPNHEAWQEIRIRVQEGCAGR